MEQPEYMRMKLSNLPQEFADLYDLTKIAEDNGNVYIKVKKGRGRLNIHCVGSYYSN